MCISKVDTWFSGAYLTRSSGHILLRFLSISGWLSRSLISWLLFCEVRFLWFFTYVLMNSVTYGMLKSLCEVTFDTYQGALATFLNVLDWNTFEEFLCKKVCCIPTALSHRWCIILRITGYLVFVYRPVLQITRNTVFRKVDLFPSSCEEIVVSSFYGIQQCGCFPPLTELAPAQKKFWHIPPVLIRFLISSKFC
jgi:hypothetical protein